MRLDSTEQETEMSGEYSEPDRQWRVAARRGRHWFGRAGPTFGRTEPQATSTPYTLPSRQPTRPQAGSQSSTPGTPSALRVWLEVSDSPLG